MAAKEYIVEGRQFRTGSDYARAIQDKKIIDRLRAGTDMADRAALEKLLAGLKKGRYQFSTLLGEDFAEEVEAALRRAAQPPGGTQKRGKGAAFGQKHPKSAAPAGTEQGKDMSPEMDADVREELKRRERRRKLTIFLCSLAAAGCLGYFGVYSWYTYRTGNRYEELSELKNKPPIAEKAETPAKPTGPLYTLDDAPEPKEVLDEYKNLLIKYKKLIGWLTFADKTIGGESGFPVMQTSDNEYYLTHNMDQEYDKNGTIFLDKDCDIAAPSTNFIVYGHHMQSGRMFGKLDLYQKKEYCEKYPHIQFDTIYEKGTYEVMYVFRSRVYREGEIAFKYYQFIDANSQQEFDSYMEEMAAMALYDTGVAAEYGDQLLTLSTCDYQETGGRFVVVAKKIKE